MKNYFNDKFLFIQQQNILPFLNKNKKNIIWTTFSIFLVGFSVLAAYVMLTEPHYIDVHISEEIQEKQNGFLDSFMKAVSWFGRIRVSAVLIGCSTILFLLLKRKKDALLMLSTLISGGIAWVLKTLINRPRPTKDFVSILEETHYQSFPSGHVLFYTVFFGALIFILIRTIKKYPILKISGILICLAMIFLGAVSRVYLGAHWFTDVLGGFLAGLMYLLIAGHFYFDCRKKSI
ncbi:phosphatase PAP2 family protein [Elizabethkingia anophelis]|uniref:phosphatase PAP2 family protein n=1 Tax=Elizabethkingia anophelis TaxID=1117645 RepID=UPI0021A458C0|nr:phosphatase PAP2 family protein [Elizabethkingia anophelis]